MNVLDARDLAGKIVFQAEKADLGHFTVAQNGVHVRVHKGVSQGVLGSHISMTMRPLANPEYGGSAREKVVAFNLLELGGHAAQAEVCAALVEVGHEVARQRLAERVWRECAEPTSSPAVFGRVIIMPPLGRYFVGQNWVAENTNKGASGKGHCIRSGDVVYFSPTFSALTPEDCGVLLAAFMTPAWKIRNAVRDQEAMCSE